MGQVLYGQLLYHFVRGELDQAERQAGEYRRLAQVHNDQNWQHASSHLSGALCCVRGKFTEACAYFENAIWDPKVRAFVPSPEDPYVSVRMYYCRALLCLGQIDEALLRINEALAEARRISPFNTAYALNLTSIGYWPIYGKESAEAGSFEQRTNYWKFRMSTAFFYGPRPGNGSAGGAWARWGRQQMASR